ncbi:MAG: RNA polymerase sigma factor [Tabrizicola sp.]|nr:RNA polymerase sigma factor [Tabrizicola sp.]
MLHTEIFQSDLPHPQPVEPDPCTRIVARRGNYLTYLRRRVSDPDTAEDLLQDFNLKVIQASRRTSTIHNTDAWLSRVLRNTLFDHYRRCDARRRADAAHAVHVTVLSASDCIEPDAVEVGSDGLQLAEIEGALERVRPDQAALLRALYLHDQPRERLAREFNITIGTLNVRVLRARRALRDALMEHSTTAEMDAQKFGNVMQYARTSCL